MEERKTRALVDATLVIDIKKLETGSNDVASASKLLSIFIPPLPMQA